MIHHIEFTFKMYYSMRYYSIYNFLAVHNFFVSPRLRTLDLQLKIFAYIDSPASTRRSFFPQVRNILNLKRTSKRNENMLNAWLMWERSMRYIWFVSLGSQCWSMIKDRQRELWSQSWLISYANYEIHNTRYHVSQNASGLMRAIRGVFRLSLA